MYSNAALSVPQTGAPLSQVQPLPRHCWAHPQQGWGRGAGLGQVCQLCPQLEQSCAQPALLCDSDPAQPQPAVSEPPALSQPFQAAWTNHKPHTPGIHFPVLPQGPFPRHRHSLLRSLTLTLRPACCPTSTTMPCSPLGCQRKPKSPPAFDDISLSYTLLAFYSSASHTHTDGLALTCYKRSSLRDL